jgi:hypothetical protein
MAGGVRLSIATATSSIIIPAIDITGIIHSLAILPEINFGKESVAAII